MSRNIFTSITGKLYTMKPRLMWEKWRDPYFKSPESDNYDDTDEENDEITTYQDEEEENQNKQGMKVVVTPMGAIPLLEQSSPNKVFNLWTAHTNFSITPEVAQTVEETEGVETLDIFSRYRMRIGIGKVFNTQEIIRNININLYNIINPGSGTNNDASKE